MSTHSDTTLPSRVYLHKLPSRRALILNSPLTPEEAIAMQAPEAIQAAEEYAGRFMQRTTHSNN